MNEPLSDPRLDPASGSGHEAEPVLEAERRVHLPALWRQVRRWQASPEPPWLHAEVARRMDERLDVIRQPPRAILDWWSARGAGADLLRRRYPGVPLHPVEPPALGAPQSGVPVPASPWWRRWRELAPDSPGLVDRGPHWQWPVPDDDAGSPAWPAAGLLWSNMMLHWADHPAAVMAQWFDRLDEGGLLMFSCLGPDTARELESVYGTAGWGPIGAAHIDMHDLGDALVKAGFRDPVMDMERLTLRWDEPARALREIRSWGGNVAPRRFPGLRTAAWAAGMRQRWQDAGSQDGSVELTVELIYGHAVRGPDRVGMAASTGISLDAMRRMVRRRSV